MPAEAVMVPTAVQRVADGHETPVRMASAAFAELPIAGVGWIVHPRRVQRSASGASRPLVSLRYPTAVHEDADGHDTSASSTSLAPAG